MLEQPLLECPVNEPRGIVIRCFFDLLAGHLQCDGSLGPADIRRPLRRDQNMLAGLPVFGIDDDERFRIAPGHNRPETTLIGRR